MVVKVCNLNKKSFINYSGPEIGSEFKCKNIIFGYNGRGKSSLALGIIDEFLKDETKTKENYRLFNRKYISENLLLETGDNSKIKGVVANFGKKNVDTEKEIKKFEDQIKDTKQLSDEIYLLKTKTREEIDKIHEQKKGNVEIQIKPINKTIEEIVKFYQDDVIKAKKIEKSEDELLKIRGDNVFEIQKQKITSLKINDISSIEENEIDIVDNLFIKIFDDLIPSSQIIEWLNGGLEVHKEGDSCKFCGGVFNYMELKEKIEIYNVNERQKTIKILNEFNKKLSEIVEQIESLENNKDKIIIDLNNNEDVENNLKIIFNNKKIILNQITAIQNKIKDTSITSGFNCFSLKKSLNSINETQKTITKIKTDQITTLDKKINNQAVLVKGAIGVEISRNTLICDNLKIIPLKESELKALENENLKYKTKIANLKISKSTTKDFADHITEILVKIGFDFRLDLFEDDYVIKHASSDDEITIDDISEGEQNLLALLFFYYELFSDKEQINIKNNIELIIIDDPISSVDDVNKMYIFELIKNLFNFNSQIFIFTHIWNDFSDLCYSKDKNPDFQFFEVKKDNNGSKVVKTKTNETPYRHHFKEIYEFSQKSDCSDLIDCEIYHLPNIMRQILEEFLYFKIKNNSPTRKNEEIIKKVLCGNKVSDHNKHRVGVLLDICNILSHKPSRNPDEILSSAKFLMKRIKIVDSQHYYNMIG